MKKLQLESENSLINIFPSLCQFCKLKGECIAPQHLAGFAICQNCIKEVLRVFKKKGTIPDQTEQEGIDEDAPF